VFSPRDGIPSTLQTQSRVSPLGVASLSGVAVPGFTGPLTPPPGGIFVPLAEPVIDPDPSVVALPVVAVLVPDLSPGIGTLGAIALGEALWFGAGVGEPRLSYCCCANAALLRSTIAEARITGVLVMVFRPSFLPPAIRIAARFNARDYAMFHETRRMHRTVQRASILKGVAEGSGPE